MLSALTTKKGIPYDLISIYRSSTIKIEVNDRFGELSINCNLVYYPPIGKVSGIG